MKPKNYLQHIALFIILCIASAFHADAQTSNLRKTIEKFIADKDAHIGVAILLNDNELCLINDREQYPLESVMKLYQAVAVLDSMSRAGISLDTPVHIDKSDLKPNTYSPLLDTYPNGNISLTIGELLKYSLQLSDNNACDILFSRFGGPEATDKCLRNFKWSKFSIRHTEDSLHQDIDRCYENWTCPSVAAQLANQICTSRFIGKEYQEFLQKTLLGCTTGDNRLPKHFMTTNVKVGHKTGTGPRNANGKIIAVNDVGFFLLPDGRHYSVAVFIKDSGMPIEENEAVIAEISRMVYDYYTKFDKYRTSKICYRGLVDIGAQTNFNRLDALTSHGCQFGRYAYLGAGFGINYYPREEKRPDLAHRTWKQIHPISIPIFGHFRGIYPMISTRFLIFADLKLGYAFKDMKGMYKSFGGGAGYSLNKKCALTLALSFTVQDYKAYRDVKIHEGGLSVALGFMF